MKEFFFSSDKLTSLLMLPHVDGCTVHVCHNGTQQNCEN